MHCKALYIKPTLEHHPKVQVLTHA